VAEKQYCGKGRLKTFSNGGSVINFGLNMSQLPPANDKGWVQLTIAEMRSPDQWGNTHTVYVDTYQRTESAPQPSGDRVENVPDGDGMPF
jgi:hypothetical protein